MNEASRIVLGSPALEQFQFRLNRGERYLETRTAEKVLCNLVRLPRSEWAVRHTREGRSQRRDGFGTALALRAWPAIEEGRDLNCHSVWQTYSLKPPRGQRVLLPWHVRGTRFSLFDSCHIPRVMSSYRYSARSGETNLQLFNTSRHEAVVSSKTGAVAVVSPVGFDVRHLNEHSLAGPRKTSTCAAPGVRNVHRRMPGIPSSVALLHQAIHDREDEGPVRLRERLQNPRRVEDRVRIVIRCDEDGRRRRSR